MHVGESILPIPILVLYGLQNQMLLGRNSVKLAEYSIN